MEVVQVSLTLLALLFTSSQAAFTTPCAQQEVLKELYRSLYDILEKNAACSSDGSQENIELLDIGIPLSYSDFNPGKQSRFAVPGELPTFVLEIPQDLPGSGSRTTLLIVSKTTSLTLWPLPMTTY